MIDRLSSTTYDIKVILLLAGITFFSFTCLIPESFADDNDVAVISTKSGNIVILLNNNATKTVANFESLANSGFYDNTIFHRIVPGFVIQGGDPNTIKGDRSTWGLGDAGYTIPPEFNPLLKFTKYAVGMARGSDVNSGSSQFFITVGKATFLDNQYSLFGYVITGKDVVDKIASLQTNASDQPIDADSARISKITIRKITGPQELQAKEDLEANLATEIRLQQQILQVQEDAKKQQEEDQKAQEILKQKELQQQIQKKKIVDDRLTDIISSRKENFNDKDTVDIVLYKAKAFMNFRYYLDAFNYYDKALRTSPNNEEAKMGKDGAYNTLSDIVSPLLDSENALKQDPNSVEALDKIGISYLLLQDYSSSLNYCGKALDLQQYDSTASYCKYQALVGLGRYDEALTLSNSITTMPYYGTTPDALLYGSERIVPLYHLGKYDDAIKYIDTKIQTNSITSQNSFSIYLLMFKGLIFEKKGDMNSANSVFSAIGNPYSFPMSKGMGFFILKDYPMAIQYLEKSQPQNDAVGYMKVIAYDEMARSNPISSVYKPTNQDPFEGIKEFFASLFHWK